MQILRSRVFWGVLLILGGAALLMQSLGVFSIGGLVWGIVLGIAGLVFLAEFMNDRARWWPLIPGCTLLGISLAILLGAVFPRLSGTVDGLLIMGGIGLSFILIYLMNHANWWAIIPGGTLVTLGLVSVVDQAETIFDPGGIFMLGMGLTFFLVALLPNPFGKMKWAYIPGVVLVIIGIGILASVESAFNYVWPAVLILGGVILAGRALLSGRGKA